jgi:hypothetical protein|tara:strand:- start:464 stop:709 length:246 start_codon:yes stop_codon:yes gene_type:complete
MTLRGVQRFFSEDSKMTQANEDNRRYKILQLVTTGWELADPDRAVNLTRDQCDATLDSLVNLEGINPTKLKVVLNETPLPE